MAVQLDLHPQHAPRFVLDHGQRLLIKARLADNGYIQPIQLTLDHLEPLHTRDALAQLTPALARGDTAAPQATTVHAGAKGSDDLP